MSNKTALSRNSNLDLLRIMACIAVVGLHTLQKDLSIINSSLYYLCGFAVPIFFMISGYILLERKSVDYYYSVRKIKAIFRLVIIWNLIYGLAKLLIGFFNHNFSTALLIEIIKNIPKGFLQSGRFWHFWYFGALILIYALLPILWRLCSDGKRMERLWIFLVLLCILIQFLSYIMRHPLQKHIKQMFRLWTWLQYFVFGGIIARNKEKILSKMKHIGLWLVIVSALVVTEQNLFGRLILNNLYAEYFYDDIVTILWGGALFSWGITRRLSKKMNVWIKTLAPLTLGVYIIHPFLRSIIQSFFKIDTLMLSLVYFLGVLIVSFGLTFLLKKMKLSILVELK